MGGADTTAQKVVGVFEGSDTTVPGGAGRRISCNYFIRVGQRIEETGSVIIPLR